MNKENTDKLLHDFPNLYRNLDWGFDVGDGWFNIIYNLSEKLSKEEGTYALQVKEKFGGLRFYISSGSDEDFDTIDKAENESYRTCELCGKEGRRRRGGWIKVLCDECASGGNK